MAWQLGGGGATRRGGSGLLPNAIPSAAWGEARPPSMSLGTCTPPAGELRAGRQCALQRTSESGSRWQPSFVGFEPPDASVAAFLHPSPHMQKTCWGPDKPPGFGWDTGRPGVRRVAWLCSPMEKGWVSPTGLVGGWVLTQPCIDAPGSLAPPAGSAGK